MIFFIEQIEPFLTIKNMRVTPKPCTLADGRNGFFLGSDWEMEILKKGCEIEYITKEEISTNHNHT